MKLKKSTEIAVVFITEQLISNHIEQQFHSVKLSIYSGYT